MRKILAIGLAAIGATVITPILIGAITLTVAIATNPVVQLFAVSAVFVQWIN